MARRKSFPKKKTNGEWELGPFAQFNKPHKPTPEKKEFFYRLYKLLFYENSISLRTKQSSLDTAIINEYPWKIVCISEEALKLISHTGATKDLRRAHPVQRKKRAEYLFERKHPLARTTFIHRYFFYDTVALVHKTENSKEGTSHWSRLYGVPEGYLAEGSFSVKLTTDDLKWVNKLVEDRKIGVD